MLFLHNIVNGIWAIDQMYARQYYPLIASWIKGERMEAHSDQGQKKDQTAHRARHVVQSHRRYSWTRVVSHGSIPKSGHRVDPAAGERRGVA